MVVPPSAGTKKYVFVPKWQKKRLFGAKHRLGVPKYKLFPPTKNNQGGRRARGKAYIPASTAEAGEDDVEPAGIVFGREAVAEEAPFGTCPKLRAGREFFWNVLP